MRDDDAAAADVARDVSPPKKGRHPAEEGGGRRSLCDHVLLQLVALLLFGVVLSLYVYHTLRLLCLGSPPPPDPPRGETPSVPWREAAGLMGSGDVLLVTQWHRPRERSLRVELLWRLARTAVIHVAPVVRDPGDAVRRAYGLAPDDAAAGGGVYVLEVGPPCLSSLLPLEAWMARQRGRTVLWRKLLPILDGGDENKTSPSSSVVSIFGLSSPAVAGRVDEFLLDQRGVAYPTPLHWMVSQTLRCRGRVASGGRGASSLHCATTIAALYAATGLLAGGGTPPPWWWWERVVPATFLHEEPLGTALRPRASLCRCQRLLDEAEGAEAEVRPRRDEGGRDRVGRGGSPGPTTAHGVPPLLLPLEGGVGVADPEVEPEGEGQAEDHERARAAAAAAVGSPPMGQQEAEDEGGHGQGLEEAAAAGLTPGGEDAVVDDGDDDQVEGEEQRGDAVAPVHQ